ncbi:MAG TPA: phosphatidylinositol mannoside acyltransferase [Candidatus Eisenbacteria bacterium]|nr:phosphatidylinositol mannoside acyltransferase [Candidatus Eisenbacteria bacterium]
MREWLQYHAFAAGWAVVRRLPERTAYRLFRVVADLAWRRRGPSVARLEANLRRARPQASYAELRALSREGMRSYLRYWCDVFRLPDWHRDRVVSTVRVENEHYLRDALASGRGVVAALMHMGNWDHAGAWASLTGAPVVTVAERLRPERLYARFLGYREGLGMEILPLTGGDGDVFDTLTQRLRAGRLVPLLADRDLRASGVEVELLGDTTRMPPGPGLLALRTGAALHPVSIWFETGEGPGGHRLVIRFHDEVKPPADGRTREKVAAMTQEVAHVFGTAIAAHPQDWHMLQPLWLRDLPSRDRQAPRRRAGRR